ncbi:hypothetical protein [Mesorhizobium sp.]|uniref:hypothetical protein n=1 Tax=Mesorhizobium sp. TaxID=1871066 RepID=UPI0025BB8D81|nr:hypothetical protein [Mesorhizobium sp.]
MSTLIIYFFVGRNQKSSRIVPYGSVTQSTLANPNASFANIRGPSEPCSKMTAMGPEVPDRFRDDAADKPPFVLMHVSHNRCTFLGDMHSSRPARPFLRPGVQIPNCNFPQPAKSRFGREMRKVRRLQMTPRLKAAPSPAKTSALSTLGG